MESAAMPAKQIIDEMRTKIDIAIRAVQTYLTDENKEDIPLPRAILTCLEEMEHSLRGQDHIPEDYKRNLFGVYRMLTDSWPLESSTIGQVLMNLQHDLYELSKRL